MIEFNEILDPATGERVLEVPFTGTALLDTPLFNKGSAFPEDCLAGLFVKDAPLAAACGLR